MSTQARNLDLEAAAFADFKDIESWRVYVDWLLSVGDPHAELASLELARLDVFRSERGKFDESISAHQRAFRDQWSAWAGARGLGAVVPTFKRGFVYGLTGEIAALAPVLDELFEREPIQRLTLLDVDDDALMQLCQGASGWFSRLRYLRITGDIGALGAAALAQPSLHRLERLNLLGNQIDAEACGHLATIDTTQLHALTLTANQIDDGALAQLLASPTRSQWRELHLSENPIDAEGIATLAATTDLRALRRLSLRRLEASFAAYAPLTEVDWPQLAKLELDASGSWSPGAREVRDRLNERWGPKLRLK